MPKWTSLTGVTVTRRVLWADRDDRDHPPEPHWCQCTCEDILLPRCPEHGWQVTPRPRSRSSVSNRAWGWRRRNKRLHAALLRGGMSARQARALFMASRPMNRRRVREWIASGRPIF